MEGTSHDLYQWLMLGTPIAALASTWVISMLKAATRNGRIDQRLDSLEEQDRIEKGLLEELNKLPTHVRGEIKRIDDDVAEIKTLSKERGSRLEDLTKSVAQMASQMHGEFGTISVELKNLSDSNTNRKSDSNKLNDRLTRQGIEMVAALKEVTGKLSSVETALVGLTSTLKAKDIID